MSIDIPGWAAQAGTLLGAGTVGAVLLRLIDKGFGRAKEEDSNRTQRRAELMGQIATLTARVDVLTDRLDHAHDRVNKLVEECAEERARVREYHAENIGLRERYHEFRSFAAVLVGTIEIYHERLGLPESERIKVPEWINRPVPGPTASEVLRASKPPEPQP